MKIKKLLLGFIISISLFFVGCTLAEKDTFKVTFYSEGKVVEARQYKKGETIELPEEPTKEGVFFIGWDKNNDGEADEITICENNMNLYAIFGETEKYTVIFKEGDTELSKIVYAKDAMPKAPEAPTKDGLVFVGWDANNDDEVDDIKAATSDITYVAIYRSSNVSYTVEFIVNGETVKSDEYSLNDVVNDPNLTPTKQKTQEHSYSFSGWDVNSDGEVETFPFVVKGNHRFIAIFDETINKYTYRLFDGLELLQSETVDYGTEVTYYGSLYKIDILGHYHYLLGWDKNGDNKPDELVVTENVDYRAIFVDEQIVLMHYDNFVEAKYVPKGETFDLYEPTLPSSRKCVWYLDEDYTIPYNHGPMIEGNLEIYGRSELSYTIDCSVLEMTPKTKVESEEELIALFNYLIFSREYSYTVTLNYTPENEDFATLLCNRCQVDCSYQLGSSYNSFLKQLTLTIQYKNVNTTSIKSLYEENSLSYYTQYNSLNLVQNEPSRTDDFKLFIDDVENTFEVSDSEQLYYVLEHGLSDTIVALQLFWIEVEELAVGVNSRLG